jgi:hypothetical protein
MAEVNGNPKGEVQESVSSSEVEFESTMTLLRRHSREMGPWTEEDERWFRFMTREFGGAPERDPDL